MRYANRCRLKRNERNYNCFDFVSIGLFDDKKYIFCLS